MRGRTVRKTCVLRFGKHRKRVRCVKPGKFACEVGRSFVTSSCDGCEKEEQAKRLVVVLSVK